MRDDMSDDIRKLYEQIDDIAVAMMTTRRSDGHLRSRAMANQKHVAGADLWFVTAEGSAKLDDLAFDPHVNLTYFRDGDMSWVSVSGVAVVSRDRARIHELYAADWNLWFPADGEDPRHGTADDPRMVLIGVTVHAAEFLSVNVSKPRFVYEAVKGWLTGTEPEVGEMHELQRPHRPSDE
jgi:general stress protein 26